MKLFRLRLFRYLKKGVFFLFLIPVVYFGIQVYLAFQNNYITQIAVEHDLSESISTTGIAIRDEVLIPGDSGDILRYIPVEGERVSKDSEIAYVFTDIETAQNNTRLEREEDYLNVLEDSSSIQENLISDISNISKQQLSSYYALLDVLNTGELSAIHEPKNDILLNYNRMQLAMDVPYNPAAALSQARSTVELLQQQTQPSSIITSPDIGYFVRDIDGGELLYDKETAEQWGISDFTSAIQDTQNLTPSQSYIGKIILDYKWDYYCTLPEIDSGRLTVGADYEIIFNDVGGEPIPVELVKITDPDENGQTLLQFSCETLTPEVATIRQSDAEIVTRNYTGIRVSRDALRIVDGEKGVYVQFGNLIQFKNVAPLFENDEYMLLPFNSDEENEVELYDLIVVEGRDLYDGKFL